MTHFTKKIKKIIPNIITSIRSDDVIVTSLLYHGPPPEKIQQYSVQ